MRARLSNHGNVAPRAVGRGGWTMIKAHVHPKDCPDQKAAAIDRKEHEAARLARQTRLEILAHAEWFEWYESS